MISHLMDDNSTSVMLLPKRLPRYATATAHGWNADCGAAETHAAHRHSHHDDSAHDRSVETSRFASNESRRHRTEIISALVPAPSSSNPDGQAEKQSERNRRSPPEYRSLSFRYPWVLACCTQTVFSRRLSPKRTWGPNSMLQETRSSRKPSPPTE